MLISIATNRADQTLQFAAEELQAYLTKMTPAKITLVGDATNATVRVNWIADDETLDHVVIDQRDGRCDITGNRPVAALIGVYEYLHHLGARFLRPGKAHDLLPAVSADFLLDDYHYDHVASYKHRGVCIEGADSVENIVDFIDWLPKNGYNSFFVQFENSYTFLKRWYDHESNNYLEREALSTATITAMNNAIDQAIQVRGLHHHRVGHGWTGEVLGYSSKFGWESGVTLPKEKEPLVALVNGKRALINDTPIFTSLDFANPEVNEKMARVIVDYAATHQNVDYLHVWLSDANNNICECDACQKTTPSDQYVEFLNLLDEKLTAADLDTKICFLLYHELLFAPQHAKIKHPDRFTMMFAPISRTFEKSYADVDYEHGIPAATPYVRNDITLPNSLEANLAFLFDWQKQFNGDSFVYDYPLGRAHYGDLGYMRISEIISRDIKFLDQLHLNGYISCQELRSGLPTTLPNYVMGRTLWDKSADYNDLCDEYFTAAFGDQGDQVRKYLQAISDHSSSDYFNAIGPRHNPEMGQRFEKIVSLTTDFLTTVNQALPETTGVQRQNWRVLDYHRQAYGQLALALADIANDQTSLAEAEWRGFVDFIKLHEAQFQPYLDVYRIIEVATNYAGFQYKDPVK